MSARQHFLSLVIISMSLSVQAVDNSIINGVFENVACLECHETTHPKLVTDWRKSAHASTQPVTDCVVCHGQSHQTAASVSRKDTSCINCHGGNEAPVAHSYTTSKHGVIMQIEKKSYNWQQPLKLANYRAPGCAYCHMYQGEHNVNSMIRHSIMDSNAALNTETKTREVCQDCHAPRYITELLTNGEAMLEIARKKVREADKLITEASVKFKPDKLLSAREIKKNMQHHLTNVYLGAAHQSPDYQWWHGQPALDGDLLRIKALISELYKKPIKQ